MSDTPLTIPHLALHAAARWADQLAVIDDRRRIRFDELAALMRSAAAAFISAGIEPGQRVALWAPNCADWIIACLGLQAAGGVLVPLNTRFRGQEAAHILNRSKAVMLVSIDEFLGVRYPQLLEGFELPHLQRTVRLGASGPDSWDAFIAATDPDAIARVDTRLAQLNENSVSDIMFTSGTTGEPKGAITTHGQTVRTGRLWTRATTLGDRDRFLILWPFFHTSGYKGAWVPCLTVGATILPEAQLNVDRLIEKVAREGVTFLPGPPTLFQSLLSAKVKSLGTVRVAVTGASSVAPSLIESMRNELGIPKVLTGYGLTETCGTATMTSAHDPPEVVVRTCGRAVAGVELAVMPQSGERLAVGGPGEILIRGMNVMQGYLDDPKSTAEAIDADGWLHTGDVGIIDAAGYLSITDRKKDMFIVGGFNCYPAEIERMLLAHPAIAQVAITSVPDERLGEVGRAHVVLKPGASLDEPSLIAWARERMANFKVPRSVRFTNALPTNATGKVQKFKLADS